MITQACLTTNNRLGRQASQLVVIKRFKQKENNASKDARFTHSNISFLDYCTASQTRNNLTRSSSK